MRPHLKMYTKTSIIQSQLGKLSKNWMRPCLLCLGSPLMHLTTEQAYVDWYFLRRFHCSLPLDTLGSGPRTHESFFSTGKTEIYSFFLNTLRCSTRFANDISLCVFSAFCFVLRVFFGFRIKIDKICSSILWNGSWFYKWVWLFNSFLSGLLISRICDHMFSLFGKELGSIVC